MHAEIAHPEKYPSYSVLPSVPIAETARRQIQGAAIATRAPRGSIWTRRPETARNVGKAHSLPCLEMLSVKCAVVGRQQIICGQIVFLVTQENT